MPVSSYIVKKNGKKFKAITTKKVKSKVYDHVKFIMDNIILSGSSSQETQKLKPFIISKPDELFADSIKDIIYKFLSTFSNKITISKSRITVSACDNHYHICIEEFKVSIYGNRRFLYDFILPCL